MFRNSILAFIFAANLLGMMSTSYAASTPPIMPHTAETPLPPAITLPAPTNLPGDVPTTPLTAEEAVQIALHYQPSLTVAGANATAAQGRLQQAKSSLLPSVTVNTGYNNSVVVPRNGAYSNQFVTASTLHQLLYDFNHTRDLVRQSEQLHQSSLANLSRAQSDLVYQVKEAYYTYAQNTRLVSTNESNLRNRHDHLAMAKARVNAGVGLPIDVVRAETAVSEATLSLNVAQNQAAISRVSLAELMGIDPRTPIQVDEEEEPSLPTDDFNGLLQTAMQNRPEIAQAQANLLAAGYGLNAAKSSNSPSIYGAVGYGLRGDNFSQNDDSLNLGLTFEWNAYDSGYTKGKVKEAQANIQSAQAELSSTKLAVSSDVSQAYLNEKTAEQRVITADAEVANAEEGVRLAQGRYNAGLGIFLDVLDAQTALYTAQTNRVNAQTAVNVARAALAHAIYCDPTLTDTSKK